MNNFDVKRMILACAIIAEIDGMKACNKQRLVEKRSIGYGEEHFFGKAEELRILASKHDEAL